MAGLLLSDPWIFHLCSFTIVQCELYSNDLVTSIISSVTYNAI